MRLEVAIPLGMMQPIMGFIGNLGYVVVSILGGWLAFRQAITVGDIQAFIQYVRSFTQPITQLANISNVLQQTLRQPSGCLNSWPNGGNADAANR